MSLMGRSLSGRAALALLGVMFAGAAFAQGSAVLTGTVTDAATRQPVADVVVTATAPQLQGEQVVVTDALGLYRIPQLPPGSYTLRFEKERFKPFTRAAIPVQLDKTVRLNVELLPESIQGETIEVVGRAPTIDVGSANTGVNVSADFIRNIAMVRPGSKGSAARSFESLAEIAPGANADQYGVSVNGTTSPENQFIIDGVSVNDPGFGIIGTPLSVEFVQQVNVITGGYMPEYGRATGGILNAVTKSGSNEFHGSVWGNFTPGALEGFRPIIQAEGQTITTRARLWNQGDFGADLGGPILKDKLWFYAGISPSFNRSRLERNLNTVTVDEAGDPVKDPATGFTQTTQIPGTQRFYFADQRTFQYIGKLTYLINADHNVSVSVYGTPSTSGGNGSFAFNPRSGAVQVANITGSYEALANVFISQSNDVGVKYSGSFLDKRVLLDASFGWHHQREARLASDGSPVGGQEGLNGVMGVVWRRTNPHPITDFEALSDPSVCVNPVPGKRTRCPVTNYNTGGPGFTQDALLDRYQGKVVGTFLANLLGHHVIKTGVDVEYMSYHNKRAYTGRILLREATSGNNFADFRHYGYLTAPDQPFSQDFQQSLSTSVTAGGFVQDSWSVLDLFTVNAGLRYDAQTMYGNDRRVAVALPNQISPRVGVIYDFTRQGRSKLFANYARYFENVPLNMIDRAFPAERRLIATRNRLPNATTGAPGCNPLDVSQQRNECQDPRNFVPSSSTTEPNQLWSARGGGSELVDENLKPQSSDELVLGGEYEVIPDGRAGLQYVKRYMNSVIEDMSRDEATTYFIGNPGEGIARDFDKAVRDYDAVTVYFDKTFADLWLANVSYTYASLRGNYAGLFRPETGQLDPNINSDFDLISLVANRLGPLPGDRTHQLKVFGAKEFVIAGGFSTNIGLSYRALSGAPTNYLGSHPLYGAREVFILPRGSGPRLPWNHIIDTHVGLNYRLSKDNLLSLSVDIFNLFNFQGMTGIDQTYTNADVLPIDKGTRADVPGRLTYTNGTAFNPADQNPNFGNLTAFQDPRRLRFGVRMTF